MKTRAQAFASFTFSVLLTFATFVSPIYANPQDGTVVAGQATIQQPDANTVQIHQTSNKAIIDWRSFNIAANERTLIQQPNSSALLLSRVTGGDPSKIFGQLSANGKVVLVNPAGIYFGPSARVNVNSLIATTGAISNADFLAGNLHFVQAPNSATTVINAGEIKAAEGLVALVAPGVANSGVIQANLGKVALASGNEVTVDLYGDQLINFAVANKVTQKPTDTQQNSLDDAVKNTGTLIADGGKVLLTANVAQGVVQNAINLQGVVQARSVSVKNGEIILDGGELGQVNVSGKLDASGKTAGAKGGSIKVLGKKVQLQAAQLDASGDQGGGQILVGGNFQGQGPERNASTTAVDAATTLNASALSKGNGGKVIVWADDHTDYAGHLAAKGGTLGGNGGLTEVSGKQFLNFQGTVDLTAAQGTTGTLLLDPYDITISTGADTKAFSNNYVSTGNNSIINTTTLINALANASVTIQTGDGPGSTGLGNITISNDINWNSANSLTLNAYNNITLNNSVKINNGGIGNITLRAGYAGLSTSTGTVVMNTGAQVTTNGAVKFYYNPSSYTTPTNFTGVTANLAAGGFTPYMLINTATQLNTVSTTFSTWGSNFALGNNIDASSLGNFNPIGNNTNKFTGKFDGQNFTISNLTINQPTTDYAGLFGATQNATVANLQLANANITGRNYVGALMGAAQNATTTNVQSTNTTVNGTVGVGGLIGDASQGLIANNTATAGTVTGNFAVGGLIGTMGIINNPTAYSYQISNSHTTGTVTALLDNLFGTGGFIGRFVNASNSTATAIINNSYSTAMVIAANTLANNIGGFIGNFERGGTINTSYSTGNVISSGSIVGGFVGSNEGTINTSYSTGNVIGTLANDGNAAYDNFDIGGFAGVNSSANTRVGHINNSYSTGNVSGNGEVGGFIGYQGGFVTNSYSLGKVTATLSSGGFAGTIDGSGAITNSYWNTETSGKLTDAAGSTAVGKTSAELQRQTTFTGWDFTNTWNIIPDVSYPFLRAHFPSTPQVVSGTVYADQGTTPILASSNNTVSLVAGGNLLKNTSTYANGAYYALFNNNTLPLNTGVLAYLTNSSNGYTANTVVLTNNAQNTGINLYNNTLIARSDAGSAQPLSNSSLIAAKNGLPTTGLLYSNTGNNITVNGDFITWGGTNFNLNGNLTLNGNGNFISTLSGNGALNFAGSNKTYQLQAANTYIGNTTLNGGTLAVGNNAALGNSSNNLSLNGGTLTAAAPNLTLSNAIVVNNNSTINNISHDLRLTGNVTLNSNAILTKNGNFALFLNGIIAGNGSLALLNNGDTILNGNNTYIGNTVLNSGTLILGNNAALGNSSNNLILNGGTLQASTGLTLTLANTFTVAGTSTIGGTDNLTLSGAGTLTADLSNINSGVTTLSGNLSGTGNLMTAGTRLALTGNNSGRNTSASTTLTSGVLEISNNNALGNGALQLNGGTFQASTALTLANAITVGGATSLDNANSLTLNGTVGLNAFLAKANAGTLTLNGIVSGNGGLVSATGTTVLNGNNSYTGGTTLTSGTLNISSNTALGDSMSNLILNGGTLNLTNAVTSLANNITVGGATNFNDLANLSLNGNIVLNADLTRRNINSGTLTLNGTISGTTGKLISTLGNVVLNGNNTYAGGTSIGQGGLTVNTNTAAGTGRITVSQGSINVNSDVVLANDYTIGNIAISGNHNLTLNGAGTLTGFVNNSNTGITTLNGAIDGSSGGFANTGTQLVLNGNNNYTGITTLSSGILSLGSNSALGDSMLRLNGGTLQASTALTLANAFTVAGTSTLGGTHNLTFNGAGTLNAGLALTNTGVTTFNGNLSGTAGLTSATGTTVLNGNNSYTGGTTLNSGTLQVGSNTALGASTSAVTLNGGTLLSNATVSLANPVAVQADTTFAGTGNLTLAGSVALNSGVQLDLALPAVTFANTLNGAGRVTAANSQVTVGGTVGQVTPLTSFAVNAGHVNLNGGRVTTTGDQTYANVTLGANTTLVASNGALNFLGTINGTNQALALTGNSVSLNGAVGGMGALGTINLGTLPTLDLGYAIASSGITGNIAQVNVTSTQAKIDTAVNLVTAGGTVNVTPGTYNEDVVIGKVINLQANAGVVALRSFTNNADLNVSGQFATTHTGFTFNRPLNLLGNTTFDAGTSNLTLGQAVTGNATLSLRSLDNITINTNIGTANNRLGALVTTGNTTLNAANYYTQGDQTFNGAVTLGGNVLLDTLNGSLTFNSTLTGAHDLTLNASSTGDITFVGAAGSASNRLGAVHIANARNVVEQNVLKVSSFTQLNGSGTTAFGTQDVDAAGSVYVNTNYISGLIIAQNNATLLANAGMNAQVNVGSLTVGGNNGGILVGTVANLGGRAAAVQAQLAANAGGIYTLNGYIIGQADNLFIGNGGLNSGNNLFSTIPNLIEGGQNSANNNGADYTVGLNDSDDLTDDAANSLIQINSEGTNADLLAAQAFCF